MAGFGTIPEKTAKKNASVPQRETGMAKEAIIVLMNLP